MTSTGIGFFTPVQYVNQHASLRQKMTALVDDYFYVRGRVAVVISGQKKNGSQLVILQAGRAIWWRSILKVMSYMAFFFIFFVNSLFPNLATHRKVVQFQMILSGFPLFMLIAKIMLRSTSSYTPLIYGKRNLRDDRIPGKVKKTLDVLFGGEGSVNEFPNFLWGDSFPFVNEMKHRIIKGVRTFHNPEERRQFFAIKMRCLSSESELMEKSVKVPSFNFSESIDKVLVLCESNKSLSWYQEQDSEGCPNFFECNCFTDSEDGTVVKAQSENFKLLQEMIKNGEGKDANGIRWKII